VLTNNIALAFLFAIILNIICYFIILNNITNKLDNISKENIKHNSYMLELLINKFNKK
jgi:flagellar motor component MotA